jgi:hypothetical protein
MRTMKLALLLSAAVGVSCCGGGAAGGDVQQIALGASTQTNTSKVSGAPPLGVNLEGLADWARLPPFVDMMKTSRPWGTADAPWTETSAVDSLGWPTGDAGVVVRVLSRDANEPELFIPQGTYKLKFTGRGNVSATASPGVSTANAAYDSATNTSTADVIVGAGAYQLNLSFRNTSGGVKNVSLRQPGYADTDTFTNEFKQAVAPFTALRFMDFLATNATQVSTWTQRTTPASATQASTKGGSFEYAIQMANELGKDIWINIPVNADDAYVRALADLLNRTLAPDRVVYFEYDNELWNWAFPHSAVNMNMAVAEAVAGDTSLTNGTQCTQAQFDAGNVEACNKYWAGLFRVGKKIVSISKIFSEVMGASALNTRFRPVYATQWGYLAIGEQVLKNIAKYRGAPSNYLYGIAGAPYFTLPYETYTSTTLTADAILQGLQRSVDVDFAPYFTTGMSVNGTYSRGTPYNGGDWTNASQKALAEYYKIKSMSYEGGLDLGQSAASGAAKMQANNDPRMGDVAKSELDQWFGCGNDLFMYYSLTSAWGQWGYWGMTNDGSNLNSPRYVAAQKVAQTPATNFTCR